MIADDKLNRLSTLIGLNKSLSDNLGAVSFTRALTLVNADLNELLAELEEENPMREKTEHEILTTGNAERTSAPLPPPSNVRR